uniref:Transposase n=1 Tax=Heterorhabditis bacteriophora TaxID=37862 RepID=A0A1I7WD06_HETBA
MFLDETLSQELRFVHYSRSYSNERVCALWRYQTRKLVGCSAGKGVPGLRGIDAAAAPRPPAAKKPLATHVVN